MAKSDRAKLLEELKDLESYAASFEVAENDNLAPIFKDIAICRSEFIRLMLPSVPREHIPLVYAAFKAGVSRGNLDLLSLNDDVVLGESARRAKQKERMAKLKKTENRDSQLWAAAELLRSQGYTMSEIADELSDGRFKGIREPKTVRVRLAKIGKSLGRSIAGGKRIRSNRIR